MPDNSVSVRRAPWLEDFAFIFLEDFIYLFMRDKGREREAETRAEGEADSMQGAPCGTRSQVSRILG